MDNLNLPPFYIGQKVVALKTASDGMGHGITKDAEYTVIDQYRCRCGLWKIDIAVRAEITGSRCNTCREVKYVANILWANSELFAPITSTFVSLTFSEVIAIESPVTCMQ